MNFECFCKKLDCLSPSQIQNLDITAIMLYIGKRFGFSNNLPLYTSYYLWEFKHIYSNLCSLSQAQIEDLNREYQTKIDALHERFTIGHPILHKSINPIGVITPKSKYITLNGRVVLTEDGAHQLNQ